MTQGKIVCFIQGMNKKVGAKDEEEEFTEGKESMGDKKKSSSNSRNQRTDAGLAEPQNTGCEIAQREKIRND